MSLFIGGCYDTAKRKIKIETLLPTVFLKQLENGVPIQSISKFIDFDSHGKLPNKYKQFYGVRYAGFHEETQKPIFYGFDLFYQVSGCGLNLDQFLTFCFVNGLHIDWYNFQRTSIERGEWSMKTLLRTLSYPIIEIMGKEYWKSLEYRFQKYQWSILEDNCPIKEKYRILFIY